MVSLNARIPEQIAKEVKVRAVWEGKTVQRLVLDALMAYLKKPLTTPRGEEE
jgi:hypothetical protein